MSTKYQVTESALTGIADAIRAKGNTSELLTFPDGFKEAIEDISSFEPGPDDIVASWDFTKSTDPNVDTINGLEVYVPDDVSAPTSDGYLLTNPKQYVRLPWNLVGGPVVVEIDFGDISFPSDPVHDFEVFTIGDRVYLGRYRNDGTWYFGTFDQGTSVPYIQVVDNFANSTFRFVHNVDGKVQIYQNDELLFASAYPLSARRSESAYFYPSVFSIGGNNYRYDDYSYDVYVKACRVYSKCNIKSGVLQTLNVSSNGTYTPDPGVDGFDEVIVNVSGGGTAYTRGVLQFAPSPNNMNIRGDEHVD